MTEQTQPTDAELWAAIERYASAVAGRQAGCIGESVVQPVRQKLEEMVAKWGTPAGAVEPDNAFPLASKIYKRGDEWVLEVSGTINDCHFTCRHTQPGGLQPEDVAGLPTLYTTPQPNQAQAGAVPLTDEQLDEVVQSASVLGRYGSYFSDGVRWGIRRYERMLGITKGADHA